MITLAGPTAPVCRPVDLCTDRPAGSRFGRASVGSGSTALTPTAGTAMKVTSERRPGARAPARGAEAPRPTRAVLGDRSPGKATRSLLLTDRRSPADALLSRGPGEPLRRVPMSAAASKSISAAADGTDHDVTGMTLPPRDTNRQAGLGGNVTVSIPRMWPRSRAWPCHPAGLARSGTQGGQVATLRSYRWATCSVLSRSAARPARRSRPGRSRSADLLGSGWTADRYRS